jgi:hypothetical protein
MPLKTRTRCRMKFRWQNSRPRKVIAIQLLISAGKKTRDRSLMIISKSVSRNSRTRFKLVFDENTSRSYLEKDEKDERGVISGGEKEGDGYSTSMTFGWCSSRRYLTSRTADISRPSLNWPTLIFFMAILRPVASSRPDVCVVLCQPDHVANRRGKKSQPR